MLIDDFQDRVKEVDLYFEFLHRVTVSRAALRISGTRSETTVPLDQNLVKILKANAFLLLYNLVESSVRDGLTHIYDSVQNDRLCYRDLRTELREIWLHDAVDPGTIRMPDGTLRVVTDIVNSILMDQLIRFDSESLPISGNLDARKVRELATRYGFESKTHKRARGGEVLLRVKTERNALAHGSISFAECGRDVTFSTLKVTRTQVVRYLQNILENIQSYVSAGAYRRT